MRRGAAWPAERPRSRLVVGERKHGWASHRAVARRGGQGGPDAGCAVVAVSAFLSGVRCERPVSRGGCPSDGCPVRASESRCPVFGLRRPWCPTGMRSWAEAVGRQPVRLGWPGSAWSSAVPTTAPRLPEVGAWPSRLAQVVLGQRRVGFDLVVSRAGLGRGQVDQVADRERRDAGEDRLSVGSWR